MTNVKFYYGLKADLPAFGEAGAFYIVIHPDEPEILLAMDDGTLVPYTGSSLISDLITGKADKITSPVEDDILLMDSDGNLKDSGKKMADFAEGIPSGGTAGQILAKIDEKDYNAEWVTPSNGGMLVGTTAQRPQPTKTDEYTKLLLHLDSDFVDACGHTITQNGNPQISTAQSKFGGGSVLLDGNSSYLATPLISDLQFSTGDFTIDTRVYPISKLNTYPYLFANHNNNWASGSIGLFVGHTSAPTKYQVYADSATLLITSSIDIVYGVWAHIALVRHNGTITLYINGQNVGSAACTSALNGSGSLFFIGATTNGANTDAFNAYIDEFRISKGIARWTANFTPPDAAYFWEVTPIQAGLQYYDTTIKKPIWCDGISWYDAAGNAA